MAAETEIFWETFLLVVLVNGFSVDVRFENPVEVDKVMQKLSK